MIKYVVEKGYIVGEAHISYECDESFDSYEEAESLYNGITLDTEKLYKEFKALWKVVDGEYDEALLWEEVE